jgi:hypothetical protein
VLGLLAFVVLTAVLGRLLVSLAHYYY